MIKVRCVHLCSVSSHLGAVDEGEACMSRGMGLKTDVTEELPCLKSEVEGV